MLSRVAALCLAASACAEPVVEMSIVMPQTVDTFDTSCVSAVAVMVAGANIENDFNDYTWSCQEIGTQSRLGGIHDAIRGTFALEIPASGLAGIELFGWSSPTPCTPPEFMTPDLIFHSSAAYIGQDTIELPIETTLDCAKQQVKLRPVDLFTLVSGATPTAANCAASMIPDADSGYAALGQIMERDFGTGVDFYGGFRGADVVGGVSTFNAATTGLTSSCLAYDAYSVNGYGTTCTVPGPQLCAGAGEMDAPFIPNDIATQALLLDEALVSKWDGMVFVSVWDNGNPRKPIAGAKVEVPASEGQVVYVDPPTTGNAVTRRSDNQTGASGLAIVYTNQLANVKLTAGAATREVTVGSPDFSAGAALVVLP